MSKSIEVVVIGAGGTGKELRSLISCDKRYSFKGFLDDFSQEDDVIGNVSSLQRLIEDSMVICSFANYRKMMFRQSFLSPLPKERFLGFVDKEVKAYEDSYIDKTAIIFPGSIISTSVTIGMHALIYHNVVVSHGSHVGDFSIVSNGVVISGNVVIEDGCYIGAGATIIEGVRVGKNSIVAAGATVVTDIPCQSIYISPKDIRKNEYVNWGL